MQRVRNIQQPEQFTRQVSLQCLLLPYSMHALTLSFKIFRLFLISTKAGGMGINLTGANRAVIFDTSWNPSHDVYILISYTPCECMNEKEQNHISYCIFQNQCKYRIYRFGQKKTCYIYRFVYYGTMEQKIYERQIVKIATSLRVLDLQLIDSHFTQNQLHSLYSTKELKPKQPRLLAPPEDSLLSDILNKCEFVFKYHLHDDLLIDKSNDVSKSIGRGDSSSNTPVDIRLPNLAIVETVTSEDTLENTIYGFEPSILIGLLKRKALKENEQVDCSEMVPKLLAQLHFQMASNDRTVSVHVFSKGKSIGAMLCIFADKKLY